MFKTLGKRFLSIKTLTTPNENALKFVISDTEKHFVPKNFPTNAVEIDDMPSAAEKSPLATNLFKINGVKSIMMGHDFVTVNKVESELSHNKELEWPHLGERIKQSLQEFLKSDKDPINTEYLVRYFQDKNVSSQEPCDEDDDITFEIKELLKTRIRPALQDDGGDIQFRGFDPESGTVYIKLQGACKSCSLSEDTLKGGVESMLKYYVEEVREVKPILDPEEEVSMSEFAKLEAKLKEVRR